MRAGIEQARHWVEPAAADEAERLGIDPGQDVIVVERVRTADWMPVVLPRDLVPGALADDRTEVVDRMLAESIYTVLECELGVVIRQGIRSSRPGAIP